MSATAFNTVLRTILFILSIIGAVHRQVTMNSLRARPFSGANVASKSANKRLLKQFRLLATKTPYPDVAVRDITTDAPTDVEYDAVIVGGGMGGLTTAAKLVEKGGKVVVLEKYLIPGGSAAHYKRQGYTFDVGSSMMFGFGDEGTTNLITKALEAVGKKMKTVPDPTQVHYHCPPSSKFPQVSDSIVYSTASLSESQERGLCLFLSMVDH